MASVTTCKRNHWTGLDADKSGVSPTIGDTYAATDTLKLYYGNGSAWKTGLGYEFVPRNVTAWDKQVGDFTADGVWKVDGLDLSAIVPVGAVAVRLRLSVDDDAANSLMHIRQNATNVRNGLAVKTHVANIGNEGQGDVNIDADRLLDYNASNLVFVSIDLAVLGWLI